MKRKRLPKHRKTEYDYNRLQALVDDTSMGGEHPSGIFAIMELAGLPNSNGPEHIAAQLMARFSYEVSTLQMNYPEFVSYRAKIEIQIEDGPAALAVVVKPTLYKAVASAYIQAHRQLHLRSAKNGYKIRYHRDAGKRTGNKA